MATYQIEIEPEILTDENAFYPRINAEVSYVRGCPASWNDPGWADEIELVNATLIDADGATLTQPQIDDLARDYINSDRGYRYITAEIERFIWNQRAA